VLHRAVMIALDWQFDLDFPNRRGRRSISVQGLPKEADGFLGAGSQILYGVSRNQNSWEFRHVAAIADAVSFDDQRVLSDHLISLLDTSLPQNGAIGARSNVVAELPRYNGDPALRVLEQAMVARGPDVAQPAFSRVLIRPRTLTGTSSWYDVQHSAA
jgi:hypothetical protein